MSDICKYNDANWKLFDLIKENNFLKETQMYQFVYHPRGSLVTYDIDIDKHFYYQELIP